MPPPAKCTGAKSKEAQCRAIGLTSELGLPPSTAVMKGPASFESNTYLNVDCKKLACQMRLFQTRKRVIIMMLILSV